MKGSVHALIGASAPIGLVVTQNVTTLQGVVMAGIAAGFALLPDIDTPTSCASKALGGPIHKIVHRLCRSVVGATSLRRDRAYVQWMQISRRDPYHRSLTHTLAATLAVWAAAYGVARLHPIAAGFTAAFGVFLLWPLRRVAVGMVVAGAMAASIGAVVLLDPWLIALAASGGYVSHVVGDACTKAGVPMFWPIAIQGKRWWNIRLLGGTVVSGSTWERGPAVGVSLASNALLLFLYF